MPRSSASWPARVRWDGGGQVVFTPWPECVRVRPIEIVLKCFRRKHMHIGPARTTSVRLFVQLCAFSWLLLLQHRFGADRKMSEQICPQSGWRNRRCHHHKTANSELIKHLIPSRAYRSVDHRTKIPNKFAFAARHHRDHAHNTHTHTTQIDTHTHTQNRRNFVRSHAPSKQISHTRTYAGGFRLADRRAQRTAAAAAAAARRVCEL